MVVVERKTVMLTVNVDFEIGALQGTAVHQVFVYREKDEIEFDVDYCDDENLKYMGVEVSDRNKLWDFHTEMGINLNEAIQTMCVPQVKEHISKNKSLFYPFKH